jgi:hypothetical protein
MEGQKQAFQSLAVLVGVCEQALADLEAVPALRDDLVAAIEAARDVAIAAITGLAKAPAGTSHS